MQQGINIEAVKQYNASLREYKEKSAKLRAEIEFSQAELERQCKELSAELGISVTPENLQSILNERIEKINNTISVGTEILNRIKAEEVANQQMMNSGAASSLQSVATQTPPVSVQSAGVSIPGVGVPTAPDLPTTLPPIFMNH